MRALCEKVAARASYASLNSTFLRSLWTYAFSDVFVMLPFLNRKLT